jgi:hypothetical protein
MKNLILTMTAGLILLTGCSKEESYEQIEEQTIDSVYVLKQIDGTTTWETMAIDIENNPAYTYFNHTANNAYTRGLFMPSYRDPLVISWSGFTDETGTYGTAEIQMSRPGYSFHFILQTECVTVDGNAAVFGGIITEVVESSGNPPPFGVNWRFYFKVIDNEQGNSINYDLISNTRVFASPMSPSLCNIPPSHRFWSSQGYEEVHEPGFVELSDHPE